MKIKLTASQFDKVLIIWYFNDNNTLEIYASINRSSAK